MATQYCRYCTNCYVGNGNWCSAKEKELTDEQIKHTNKCRDFEFCSVDVFGDRTYQPQHKKKKPKQLEYYGMEGW